MIKKMLYGCMLIAALSALVTIPACGHYAAKGIKAETVWETWKGI